MPVIRRKWTPHPKQAVIMNDSHRFRIVPAGRRFGKSEMAIHEMFEDGVGNPGWTIWGVYPTFNDALELGYERFLKICPPALIKRKTRTSPPTIELWNDTVVSFRSADREDSLRGRGVHKVVIDEAKSVKDRSVQNELRPALSDHQGTMLAIGTPGGRGWFKTWYDRGDDDRYPNVASFTATSYENPYVADAEIEEARKDLPERVFKQEYLAQFLSDEGSVFGNVKERNVERYDLTETTGTGPYNVAADFGRAQDYTVITVLDATGRLVDFRRDRRKPWNVIQGMVEGVAKDYTPNTVFVDATRDNKIVSDLERAGLRVKPIHFTAQTKRGLIEDLAARLEKGEIILPEELPNHDRNVLIDELLDFEYSTTPSGNVSYSAPEGYHDDCVDSLAMAAQQFSSPAEWAGSWGRG